MAYSSSICKPRRTVIQFSSVLLSDLEQIMVIQDRTYPIDAAATSFQIIEDIRELNGA